MSKPNSTAIMADLNALRSLDPATVQSVRQLTADTDTSFRGKLLPASVPHDAQSIGLIDSFRPQQEKRSSDEADIALGEQAQGLAKAYLRDMQKVREQNDGRLDALGERIDGLRERAGDVGAALAGVKV